ncbi:28S ribosomal protein S22 [Sarcoptes scabiei]|uniref:28S ribosomal protein S22, mitochondrial n=1 Tax=Sarcoptes scabiei TaxID=52283 RepID=A0A834RDU9_SARSC|nr:28S ribosomal protein S22 [Sarcoptes scabiei]
MHSLKYLLSRTFQTHLKPIKSSRIVCQHLSDDCSKAETDRSKSFDSKKIDRNDMEDLFLDQRVRYLLKSLTGYDPGKVFSQKSMDNLNSPKFSFMTDQQLQMEIDQADERADTMLQMPPVKYSKTFEPKTLERDIALQGFLDPSVKLIFMDATAGIAEHERLIVVREADGTLREATRDERHRTTQIFYPVEERQIEMPAMFNQENLKQTMSRGSYKLLLDNACLHLEPDDQRYIDLCHQIYDHINENNHFDSLWSTRHYGGLVFYLVFSKKIDSLLYHLVSYSSSSSQRDLIGEAYDLLNLFYIIHPNDVIRVDLPPNYSESSLTKINRTKSARPISMDKFISLFKFYIEHDSSADSKAKLELLRQNLEIKNNNTIDEKEMLQN